jgi:hypothetical protein
MTGAVFLVPGLTWVPLTSVIFSLLIAQSWCNPGKSCSKLDLHMCHGIFLGYTGALTQIYYHDNETRRANTMYTAKYDDSGCIADQPPPNTIQLSQALAGDKLLDLGRGSS